jgi:hypothetical protein
VVGDVVEGDGQDHIPFVQFKTQGHVKGRAVYRRIHVEVIHVVVPVLVGVARLVQNPLHDFLQEGLHVVLQHIDGRAVLQGGEAFDEGAPVVPRAQGFQADGTVYAEHLQAVGTRHLAGECVHTLLVDGVGYMEYLRYVADGEVYLDAPVHDCLGKALVAHGVPVGIVRPGA